MKKQNLWTLPEFLAQGIPTKLVATDWNHIRWLLESKFHDWIKKFYLEEPVLLAELFESKKRSMPKAHKASFTEFRRKWDALNSQHHYTGMK